MKRMLVLLAVWLLLTSILAQTSESSKVKEFQSQRGVLLVKEFFDIGSVKGLYSASLDLSVVKLTQPNGSVTLKGLRVSSTKKNSYSTDEQLAFLDIDEIDALILALQYMSEVQSRLGMEKTIPYTEYLFKAKDSFEIGFLVNKGEYTAYTSIGSIGPISAFFKYSDLTSILGLVQAAKLKLETL